MTKAKDLKVMIVGGGGREHALAWKVAESPLVEKIYCVPGNGGTALEEKVENLPLAVDQFALISEAASREQVDLIVIGPDNPLAEGIVDYLEEKGHKVFGPTKEQAKLEWSKSHAKEVMQKLGIPTARYGLFSAKDEALAFARDNAWARVVKADGLAYGKGVFVCSTLDEVEEALDQCFAERAFGASGDQVIVEEILTGEELSIFLLMDGKTLLPMQACQDHKRRYEEDRGPNTGGMGAYSPVPLYDRYRSEIEEQITRPLAEALALGNFSYRGVLFVGILIADDVPYVLEFNARFGDPETQALMPRLKSDLFPALLACCEGRLAEIELDWHRDKSLCVVACDDGYPATSSKNEAIDIGTISGDARLFHAGTAISGGKLITNGGRVLAVTGLGKDFEQASDAAYRNLESVAFKGMDYRKDIGWRVNSKCQSK